MTEFGPGLHAATGRDVNVSAYDRWTGRWSRLFIPDVIAAAAVGDASAVLDICTGTGEAAAAMLPIVGTSGIVVGADISLEMVKSARARLNHPAFLPVVADGQALPFRDGCFGALVCQLGLQFFPDPARGLSEFQRVLRRGGRASLCVISTRDRSPMWGFLAEAICRYRPDLRDTLMASWSLADARQLKELIQSAGFNNVSVAREARDGTIDSVEAYWEPIETGVSSLPQAYLMLGEADRRAVREEVTAKLAQFAVDGALHLSVEMLLGCGEADAERIGSAPSVAATPTPFDPRLADFLVCPSTRAPLEYAPATGELTSRHAGLAFPIHDGIPIMLPDAARRL